MGFFEFIFCLHRCPTGPAVPKKRKSGENRRIFTICACRTVIYITMFTNFKFVRV